MWFRAFGRKNADSTPVDAVPDGVGDAEVDEADAAVLAAVSDISPGPELPKLPQMRLGGTADGPQAAAGASLALEDMWDSIGEPPATAIPGPPSRAHLERVPTPPDIPTPEKTFGSIDMDEARAAAPAGAVAASTRPEDLPVGWLVVADGPGRGAHFALHPGVSQIGRSPDETVPLAFGDSSIARHAHVSVAYDTDERRFFVGHGGKMNLVRLNGKPVLATETLSSYDRLRIGDTTLVFVALCSDDFDWDKNVGGA